jgi:Actin
VRVVPDGCVCCGVACGGSGVLPVVLHNDSQTPAAPTCCCVSSPDSCPALYLAKDAVLATFSVAKQTSVVVDAGHSATTGAQRAMLCAALPISTP